VKIKKRKIMKNPEVDTTFLPDRDRELKEAEERARLAREWMEEQVRKTTDETKQRDSTTHYELN